MVKSDSSALEFNLSKIQSIPFGLVSLGQMINYQIYGLCDWLKFLYIEELHCRSRNTEDFVEEELKQNTCNALRSIGRECQWLDLEGAVDRLHRFFQALESNIKVHELLSQFKTLREAIEDGIRHNCFYHYPKEKAHAVITFDEQWMEIIKAFPKANEDAKAAVDCWALGHNTACVFHLMRVAEHGLRALAKERKVKIQKKPLEWANWQDIISRLKAKIDPIGQQPSGPLRDAKLEFYKGALGQFEGFKDAYRNSVMHSRKNYDELQAKSLIVHVYEFMKRLSGRIGENTRGPIRWEKVLHS